MEKHIFLLFLLCLPKKCKLEKRTGRKRRLTKTLKSMDYHDNSHVRNLSQLEQKKLGSNHLFNSSQMQESISVQLHEISSVTALWSRREKSVLFLGQLFKAKLRNHSNTIHPTPLHYKTPHSTTKHPTPLLLDPKSNQSPYFILNFLATDIYDWRGV